MFICVALSAVEIGSIACAKSISLVGEIFAANEAHTYAVYQYGKNPMPHILHSIQLSGNLRKSQCRLESENASSHHCIGEVTKARSCNFFHIPYVRYTYKPVPPKGGYLHRMPAGIHAVELWRRKQ